MKRFLFAVCFLGAFVCKTFAQCSFTVSAGPDTTICANQSAHLHATVSPVGAYTYSWSPTSTLSGSTTATPTASPLATTAYTVSVSSGGCTATSTVNVNVNGAALLLAATITPNTPICPGTLVQLNASIVPNVCGVSPLCPSASTSPSVGPGTTSQTGNGTTGPTIMGNYKNSGRNQMLYTAAELTTALGGACTIDGIGFDIAVLNNNAFQLGFTISISCTNQTSLSAFNNSLTTVVGPLSIRPVAGWNDFAFSNGYNWDGTSNLVVDMCWNNPGLNGSQNNYGRCTPTAANTYIWILADGVDLCGTSAAPTATNIRPNARFGYCLPNINDYHIVWTPSTGANAVNKPDSSDPTAHPATSQDYTVAVSNGACVATKTVSAIVDTSKVSAGPDLSSCPGAATTLMATAIGAVIPGPTPTFAWTTLAGVAQGNGASIVVHPTVNTTYVVAMSGGACTHYDTVNVTLGSLNVDTTVTNVTCNNQHNGTIVITASNGTPAYSYVWSANANTGNSSTASGLAPGTYTVTANDANGCSGTATAAITQPAILAITFPLSPQMPKCNGGSDGSVTVKATGGTRPYVYAWSNSLPPDSIQNGLSANTYNVTITDAHSCSVSTAVTVGQPTAITFGPAVIQNVRCPISTTGKVTVSPTGGTGAYTYAWSANAPQVNSPTITGLGSGTYTVTVTDVNHCSVSSSNTVSPAINIIFNAPAITNPTCFGASNGSATINPAGGTLPYTYAWTPSNQTTQTATGLSAQAYTVVVTDDSMCSANTTLTLTQPGKIRIVGDSTNISCHGSNDGTIVITQTINAVAPNTFIWSNSATTQNLSNLSANTYSVTLTDANSCTAIDAFIISEPPLLALNAPTQVNDACTGASTGSLTANATGGTGAYSYVWSNTATTQSISNLAAGPYSVTVKDASSCSVTGSATITQPASGPAFGNANVTDVLCNGGATGAITVNVTGGTPNYNYAWSANAPQINNATVTGLRAGTYIVTATDAGGCSVTSSNTVNQSQPVVVSVDTFFNTSCNGYHDGSILLNTPTGGSGGNYTYTWNGVLGSNPQTNLVAGSYTVVVADANGCTGSASQVINQPAPINDSILVQNVLCYGGADGSLTVDAYGGNSPFTYAWSSGQTTQVNSQLAVQTNPYVVTITDSKGCTISSNATVSQPDSALSFKHSETQVTCPGKKDGTITANGAGGTSPYYFSVTKDNANFVTVTTGNTAIGLDSGLYTINFNDYNGCNIQDTAFIKYPIPDSFAITVDSTSCFGAAYTDGAIYVTALTANNMPYTYSIDSGPVQDTSYFGNLGAGPHEIVATNQFGCQAKLDTVVSQPVDGYATVLPKDTTMQLGQSITLQSAFGPYPYSTITSYNWVPYEGLSCADCPNPVATPYSHVSEYILTITYNGHCTASDSMRIIIENHAKPFIPNSFTPNGDGNNDVFEVYGDNIKTVNLRIFNRWGELVFQTDNQFKGWDGTYKGVLQMMGVYTYDAQITFLDDTKLEKHGSITLIR